MSKHRFASDLAPIRRNFSWSPVALAVRVIASAASGLRDRARFPFVARGVTISALSLQLTAGPERKPADLVGITDYVSPLRLLSSRLSTLMPNAAMLMAGLDASALQLGVGQVVRERDVARLATSRLLPGVKRLGVARLMALARPAQRDERHTLAVRVAS